MNKSAELPALTGSEKQIAWAEDIRRYLLGVLPGPLANTLRPQTAAAWWIDNRKVRWVPEDPTFKKASYNAVQVLGHRRAPAGGEIMLRRAEPNSAGREIWVSVNGYLERRSAKAMLADGRAASSGWIACHVDAPTPSAYAGLFSAAHRGDLGAVRNYLAEGARYSYDAVASAERVARSGERDLAAAYLRNVLEVGNAQ